MAESNAEKVKDKLWNSYLQFISGKITVQEYERKLYENIELEELPRKTTDWSGTFVGDYATNLCEYLILINYSHIDGMINPIEALELYMTNEKISFLRGINTYIFII